MIIVKAARDSKAGIMPGGKEMEKLIAAMATYGEKLAKAGALLAFAI